MEPRRRTGAAILIVLVLVVVVTIAGVVTAKLSGAPTTTTTTTSTTTSTQPANSDPYAAIEAAKVAIARQEVNLDLPTAQGAPAPVLPARAFRRALGGSDVVGFVPYYELTNLQGESLSGFTYLVYSSIDIQGSGALVEQDSANGWGSLVNGGASALVSVGHGDGDRVLLGVFAEDEGTIGPLCAHAATTGARLAGEVAPLLARYGFDGVDLDIEGQDTSDRAGYALFVKAFSLKLKALDSTWSLMVNTYPQAAEDPTDFYDVQAFAPYVTEMFVMGYDMDSTEVASADAPLTGSSPSDAEALASYVAAGLGSKTILGVPYYGYDFPASGPTRGALATASPYAVTYDAVVTSISQNHHKPLWDPITDTPYTVFERVKAWHQTWFDDPASIALKVALASAFKIAGVGAWELGMVEGQPQMLNVLDGGSSPTKLPLAHQP